MNALPLDRLHRAHRVVGKGLGRFSRAAALLGGGVVIILALLTTVSILGRWLSDLPGVAGTPALEWVGGITGNYEIMEMGIAAAIAAFMPYCQMRRGHVCVEVFVMAAGLRFQIVLTALSNLIFTAATGFIAWRLFLGMADKVSYRETTMVLGAPVWWGYLPCALFFVLFMLTCAYTFIEDCFRLTGRSGPHVDALGEGGRS